MLVRPRYSAKNPGQVTGYAVALPGDTGKDGGPVWYGGGKLAADLTWPKLRQRWTGPARPGPFTAAERNAIWEHAARAAEEAAAQITAAGRHRPGRCRRCRLGRLRHPARGRRRARQPHPAPGRRRLRPRRPRALRPHPRPHPGREPAAPRRPAHHRVRLPHQRPALTPIVLLTRLAALAEAVAGLRQSQQHAAQAAGALHAAQQLHAAAAIPAAAAARQARHRQPRSPGTHSRNHPVRHGRTAPAPSPPRPGRPAPGQPGPSPGLPAATTTTVTTATRSHPVKPRAAQQHSVRWADAASTAQASFCPPCPCPARTRT